MDRLLVLISDVGDPRLGGADSFCDRLNCRYTVSLLVIFSLIITTRQYVGEPISCWCPPHFTGSMVDYTNKVCWTTSTYFLPYEVEDIPKLGTAGSSARRRISYYQWVSFVLVCQAFFFYAPRALWRVFNKKSGIAVCTITDAAIERQRKADPDAADKTMRFMVKHMSRFLFDVSRSILNTGVRCRPVWAAIYGNYLVVLYLVIKVVYIGNVVGQIFLLNAFLSTDFHYYGVDVLRRMAEGQIWTTSERFPRTTLCDFRIRETGNINNHTVQCSLPMNLINEMFFIFLWFWFSFVGIATTVSLLMWLAETIYVPRQVVFVRNRLIALDRLQRPEDRSMVDGPTSPGGRGGGGWGRVEKFVRGYLRRDGCFILRLVMKNASDTIAAELISGLWDEFRDNEKRMDRLFSSPAPDDNNYADTTTQLVELSSARASASVPGTATGLGGAMT